MSIKLKGSTDGSVTLQAPADTSPTGTDKTFTLPTADGTSGQVLTTDGSGNLSFANDTALESGRNLIINGAQQVDQRGSGSTAIGSLNNGKYITDRWNVRGQDNTTGQASQSTNAPPDFVNSLLVEVGGTAGATSAGGNRFIRQNIEGYVLRPLRWGTSGAKAATMSFWVKGNVTGTYSFSFFSGALDQHYATTYTINSSNTWEKKTITVPGPTSGTFYTENQLALYCQWDLGTGSNYQTSTLNQWASGDKRCASGCVDFFNNANAHLRLTGVQFEAGETATQFEHIKYPDDLDRCLRYYQRLGGPRYVAVGSGVQGSNTQTASRININMRAPMRTGATVTFENLILTDRTGFDNAVNQHSGLHSSATGTYATFKSATNGGDLGRGIILAVRPNGTGHLELTAEL